MKINRESLKQAVRDHIETLCNRYLSQGSKVRGQWVVGNVSGDPGQSLKIDKARKPVFITISLPAKAATLSSWFSVSPADRV
jgi:hypothetical protein